MNWKTDSIVDACVLMQGELPRAKRALSAARRSRRDVQFNAYIGIKRAKLAIAKPLVGYRGVTMNFLKKTRKPYAAYQDQPGGGSWVTLFTPTRGEREFTTSLSVDEIEDLIRAEDARRQTRDAAAAE